MTIQSRVAAASREGLATRTRLPEHVTPAVLVALAVAAAVPVSMLAPDNIALLVALASIGSAAVYVGLRSPVWALVLLLVTMLLRLALPQVLAADPFILVFGGFVISAGIWLAGNPANRPRIGAVEVTMTLFIGWNVYSILQTHELPALIDPALNYQLQLWRYLLISTVIPFVVYYVSRAIFHNWAAIRILLITLLVIGAYSAAVSIMQFTGPQSLIWPRYIVDAPNWIGRANGLSNQPNANGIVLIVGYSVAVMLATVLVHPRWRSLLLWVSAFGCAWATYLTHTRAVYLGFGLVVIIGVVIATGYRRPFVTTLVGLGIGLAVNWTNFTSADRNAGGVASINEVHDRLNGIATGIWAFHERPWSGWGFGRFATVNTYHHQRWSEDIPWTRGLGLASHFNELGILAELGLVGLTLWLAVLFCVFRRLLQAIRTLPTSSPEGRPLAVTAFMTLSALVMCGFFVDLRLLDYPSAMSFAIAGAAVGALDRFHSESNAPPVVRLPRMRF